jgi:predicted nucleic acid-binding Zn ribbon protein
MIYDYKHTQDTGSQCSERFGSEQRMSDKAYDVCPKCGKPVERIIYPGQRPIGGGTPMHH